MNIIYKKTITIPETYGAARRNRTKAWGGRFIMYHPAAFARQLLRFP